MVFPIKSRSLNIITDHWMSLERKSRMVQVLHVTFDLQYHVLSLCGEGQVDQ